VPDRQQTPARRSPLDSDGLTKAHLVPVFIILGLFVVMAWREPQGMMLYAPTPEPPCDCESDSYHCADFATLDEAQDCFDYCWALRGFDVHGLDADGDRVACEGLK